MGKICYVNRIQIGHKRVKNTYEKNPELFRKLKEVFVINKSRQSSGKIVCCFKAY